MPERFGISFFRPQMRPAAATGMQARGAVAIGRPRVRDRVDGET